MGIFYDYFSRARGHFCEVKSHLDDSAVCNGLVNDNVCERACNVRGFKGSGSENIQWKSLTVRVKHKHVCVSLLLTVMSLSADSTLLLKAFVRVCVCVALVCFDYVSPRCCAVQWLVNVCLVVVEEQGRENRYDKTSRASCKTLTCQFNSQPRFPLVC